MKDRFTRKYETIFMLVKNQKYYFDLDIIREPHSIKLQQYRVPNKKRMVTEQKYANVPGQATRSFSKKRHSGYYDEDGKCLVNLKGKNPGDIWDLVNKPFKGAHFATYPPALVEKMLLCSTRPGDIVLDPFAGSGTTLAVAKEHGRGYVGLDLGYQHMQQRRVK
jgi:site-specific DNA-methyltransferase (cytosine-N4-specific)